MKRWICSLSFFSLVLAATAQGATIFTAALDEAQSGGTGSAATGTATLTLNDAQTELAYDILIDGLDWLGTFTPADASDDIIGLHIHLGAPGVSGPIVFGMVGPGHDLDLVVTTPGGQVRFQGVWDAADESTGADPLASHLANLFAGDLYLNVHTQPFPNGEIRGQIVPEPSTALLLALGLLGLRARRR